mmetsp:Transcript_3305/g.2760  ORF Transcript_3305/g.2760 Transcript_3305/m.2760 type:complete len:187 (-) Transcript_3305:41-601(-)
MSVGGNKAGSSFNVNNARNLRNILNRNFENLIKTKPLRQHHSPHIRPKPRKKPSQPTNKNPFNLFMKSGSKMLKRLATSQNSRYSTRLNSNKLNITDNFDHLDAKRLSSKISKITTNPRFYNNVKEKIQSSIRMLSNVRQGGRMNERVFYEKIQHTTKQNKYHSVINVIRRDDNSQRDVFTASPIK